MRKLIPEMCKQFKFTWYNVSKQYPFGISQYLKDYNCTILPSGLGNDGVPRELPSAIDQAKPDVCFLVDDIQNLAPWGQYLSGQQWMAWFPKDNEEDLAEEFDVLSRVPYKITLGKFAQRFYAEKGIPVSRVYNCVDTNIFRPYRQKEIDEFIDRIGLRKYKDEGNKIILFVGRANWRKNIECLMGVERLLLDRKVKSKLYFVTDFSEEPAKYSKLAHALRLDNGEMLKAEGYSWHKGISEKELAMFYNIADVYVTTHGGEGMGLPMVEALACGKPVVATDYTTTREFVGNDERGFAIPYDRKIVDQGIPRPLVNIEKFADKVQYLLENEKTAEQMGINGISFVERECSLPVIAKKLGNHINKFDCKQCFADD